MPIMNRSNMLSYSTISQNDKMALVAYNAFNNNQIKMTKISSELHCKI